MGCEIANAFHAQGAKVIIVKGPCKYSQNNEIESINVKTASEMLMSVEKNITNCDIFVSVAAVSDFIAKKIIEQKNKKRRYTKIRIRKKCRYHKKNIRKL